MDIESLADWPVLFGAILIAVGLAEAFLAWPLHKKRAYLNALLIGAVLGYAAGSALATLMDAPLDRPRGLVYQGLGAAVGAVAGTLLAEPMEWFLALLIVGGAGAIPGLFVWFHNRERYALGLGIALAGFVLAGSFALRTRRTPLILATAFLGGLAVTAGAQILILAFRPPEERIGHRTVLLLLGLWIAVFLAGAAHQFKHGPAEGTKEG